MERSAVADWCPILWLPPPAAAVSTPTESPVTAEEMHKCVWLFVNRGTSSHSKPGSRGCGFVHLGPPSLALTSPTIDPGNQTGRYPSSQSCCQQRPQQQWHPHPSDSGRSKDPATWEVQAAQVKEDKNALYLHLLGNKKKTSNYQPAKLLK